MSKAHDNKNPVALTFNGNIEDYPTEMVEGDFLVLSQQVINELRGKVYSEWRYAREGIWKAIYKHHFHNFNLSEKQKISGRAFFARQNGKVGQRVRAEIHHRVHAAENMSVFAELSNFIILYPKTHDLVHYLDKI